MRAFGRRAWLAGALVMGVLSLPAAATASAPYPRVAEQQNVPIVMRDGTTLYANVFRPAVPDGAPVAGAFPTILTQTPYNKDSGSSPGGGSTGGTVSQLAGRL